MIKEIKFHLFMKLDHLRRNSPELYNQAKKTVTFIESFPCQSEGMGTNYCIDLMIKDIFDSQPGHYKIDGGQIEVDRLVCQEISGMYNEGFVHIRYLNQDRRRAAHPMRRVLSI